MGRKTRVKEDHARAVASPSATAHSPETRPPAIRIALAVALAILTLVVYAQVRDHEFVNYDDPVYITENPHVSKGVTAEGLAWSFRIDNQNWHPLTWISHMIDVEMFGVDAGSHLLTNTTFHVANVILLFFLLKRMTGAVWRSAGAAALFAIHPLHVESVAWASERKDVLSTLFLLLALWFYHSFARSRSRVAYALAVLAFALGLMSKQMLVTLPFVLLLLDFWPLRRIDLRRPESLRLPLIEKIPLFLMLVPAIWIAVAAQQAMGAIQSADQKPLALRTANALVSYCKYLWKIVWPSDLIIPYSYPASISPATAAFAFVVLAGITLAVLLFARKRYLAMGWFFFIGTLVPVIGLVQIGSQAMADRYTYVPLIGVFIAVAWGVGELVERRAALKPVAAAGSVVVIAVLAVVAHRQVARWVNSETLFQHALTVEPENALARTNYADALLEQERYADAARNFALVPEGTAFDVAQSGLGKSLFRLGRLEEAAVAYRNALRLRPRSADAHNDLAAVLSRQEKNDEALALYREALRLNPSYYDGRMNLGALLSRMGRNEEASAEFSAAARLQPESVEPLVYQALVSASMNRFADAISAVDRAQLVDPVGSNRFLTDAMRLPADDANLAKFRAHLEEQRTKAATAPPPAQ